MVRLLCLGKPLPRMAIILCSDYLFPDMCVFKVWGGGRESGGKEEGVCTIAFVNMISKQDE